MSQKSVVSLLEPVVKRIEERPESKGMIPFASALVLASRSGKHFDRLHQAQPPEFRFTREDANVLKNAVVQLVPEGSTADIAPPDDSILHLLQTVRSDTTFQWYYFQKLLKRTFENAASSDFVPETDYFWAPNQKPGSFLDAHFSARWEEWCALFTFSGERYTTGIHPKVRVTISWRDFTLTEPFVHAVRTKFSKEPSLRGVMSPVNGSWYLYTIYWLDDNGLTSLLEAIELDFPHPELGSTHAERKVGQMTTDAFLTEVRKRLIADGIEISELTPVPEKPKGMGTERYPGDIRLK